MDFSKIVADTRLPMPDWSDPDALRKLASQTLRYRCWKKGSPLWEIILLNNVPVSHLPNNTSNGSLLIWISTAISSRADGRLWHIQGFNAIIYDRKYDRVKESVVPTTVSACDGKMTWAKIQAMLGAPFRLAELCLPLINCPLKLAPIFEGKL